MKKIFIEQFKDYWEVVTGERPSHVYFDDGIDMTSIKVTNKVLSSKEIEELAQQNSKSLTGEKHEK